MNIEKLKQEIKEEYDKYEKKVKPLRNKIKEIDCSFLTKHTSYFSLKLESNINTAPIHIAESAMLNVYQCQD